MTLHKVRFQPEPRFAAAGATNDQHIFIPRCLGVLGAAFHRQPFRLGQDDIVFKVGVNIGFNVRRLAPPCRAVLNVFAVFLCVFSLGCSGIA